jgi:putative FmdB family regulatory protein
MAPAQGKEAEEVNEGVPGIYPGRLFFYSQEGDTMPIFDYECEDKHRTEELRPMSKIDEPGVCEECGKASRKIITGVGAIFYIQKNFLNGKTRPRGIGKTDDWYKHPVFQSDTGAE